MKNARPLKKVLALALTFVMVFGSLGGTGIFAATDAEAKSAITWEKVDNSVVKNPLSAKKSAVELSSENTHADTDIVRVSIVLEKKSTIKAGYSTEAIANNAKAVNYRDSLKAAQDEMAAKISRKVLGGKELDVVWNLTLAANIISANVEYGKIAEIEAIPGVKKVVLENLYTAAAAEDVAGPNMGTAREMIGSTFTWAQGYTGAGSKVAIIDTGIDDDHQSFNANAYNYAMQENADAAEMTLAEYKESVGVLTLADVQSVWKQLNIAEKIPSGSATQAYKTDKVPFAANYIDNNFTINHDSDSQGEHGSHVTGIAAANRYIPGANNTYSEALETVRVQGVAPDAQIVTMKVFGKGGGAYDSDYMAAIEDAVVLGCDSANLSLGSSAAGTTYADEYEEIMNDLTEAGTVVVMSAGNSYQWPYFTSTGGYPYGDDLNFDTVGSPGSFTNSLAVASVDNAGVTGTPLLFGDERVFFTETSGPNAAFTTLAGTQNYVLFDSVAVDGNGTNLLTNYRSVISGKIVLVYRGESSFYQKMDAVANLGAKGCIVVNNQPGTISMSLDDAKTKIPCVSITQADGEKIKELSAKNEAGYWEGTLTVTTTTETGLIDSGYYTMSDFSSWGVPGSLQMKPEITAPGGSIYSVNGLVKGGKAYELMSGTSMAAPQITGCVAVLAQALRENGYAEKSGMTARQLANSLLMSTADPLLEGESGGNYYSILKTGAGLARIDKAATAGSYILMGKHTNSGAADGKVKVELGDDPEREGVYEFDFYINNLTDADKNFNLRGAFFTQDLWADEDGVIYTDTWTTPLSAAIEWTVDGERVIPATDLNYDFDGDEDVDTDDGQALLDLATTVRESIYNPEYADFDEDGDIDTYDAYLFFKAINKAAALVPADGSAHVECKVTLLDIDDYDLDGAYVEGFVFAEEMLEEDGALGDVHSIPVLGYYGSWTDASMFDRGSYNEYLAGTETYTPYMAAALKDPSQSVQLNSLGVVYPGDSSTYVFGGNPAIEDETYMPERDALNKDTKIAKFNFAVIRTAAASKFEVTDESGKVYTQNTLGAIDAPYYDQTNAVWRNASLSFSPSYYAKGVEDGTRLTAALTIAPEYYVNGEDVAWDELGAGATKAFSFTVDSKAPVIKEVKETVGENGAASFEVSCSDNQYIAAVALFTETGDLVDAYGSDPDAKAGDAYNCTFNVTSGTRFLVQVYDYADNISTYKINLNKQELEGDYKLSVSPASVTIVRGNTATVTASATPWGADDRVTWSSADESIATVDANGVITGKKGGTTTVTATSVAYPTVTATVNVEVTTIKLTLKGTLQDAEGKPMFFSWNLETDDTWKKDADIPLTNANIGPFAWDETNTYTTDGQTSTRGYMYDSNGFVHIFDMSTLKELSVTERSQLDGDQLGIIPDDIAMASLYNKTYKGSTYAFGVYAYYLLEYSPLATNVSISATDGVYNLSSYLGNAYFAAICSGGTSGTGSRARELSVCVDTAGKVWTLQSNSSAGLASLSSVNSTLTNLDWPMMEDGSQGASLVKGRDNNYYLSYFNGDSIDIYQLKLTTSGRTSQYVATKIANLGADVWPCALYEVSVNSGTNSAEEPAAVISEEQEINIEKTEFVKNPTADGALNSIKIDGSYDAAVKSAAPMGGAETTSVVTLTALDKDGKEVDSTNGLLTATWDPEALELVSVNVKADYKSVKTEDGKVIIGYVDLEGIAAGEAVAELTFKYKDHPACVTVAHSEESADEIDYTEVICLFDHEFTEVRDAKEATCTEDGYTGDTYCIDCGELIAKGEVIKAKGHSWGEWTQSKAPTCTEEGEETRECSVCHEKETRSIAATGHAEGVLVGAKEATCTEEGYTGDLECPVCHEVLEKGEVIPAKGHSWSEWTVVTAPTCTEDGEETRECSVCHEKESRVIEATGHGEGVLVRDKAATCTEDGYTGDLECPVCHEVLEKGEVIPATGHVWGEWTETKAPTCTEEGEETRECCVCHVTETRPVAATGHGEGVLVGAKEATCTEDGYTGDLKCPDCDVTLEEGEVIPALGHDFDTSQEGAKYVWNEDKTECKVVFTCKNCGEKEEHDCTVEEEVVKEPTETEPGLKKITATYTDEQGNVYTTTVEVVIPVKTSPETGLIISGIGALGALGAAAYVFGRKRKEDEE